MQVYQARMTHLGRTDWLAWDKASVLLADALPADARRLADLIEAVGQHGRDTADCREEVIRAYRGWQEELRRWFAEHQEPLERALLVAAATLSPTADAVLVYSAAASLARRLEVTTNGGGLAWCPVTRLRALLDAEQGEGRVVFRRHGFAESALRHALADYPLARPDLLTWLAALPTDKTIQNGRQNELAETFADLAAEHGTAELITGTAHEWGVGDLADLAFIALSRTCLHPRVGGQIRRALYDWSRKPQTPQTLKLVISRTCEPLGQALPLIALTRLKHLATHGNPQVRGQVLRAAQALSTSGHYSEVIMAALSWCAETNSENLSSQARQRRRRAGAMLFLELARPVTDSGIPEVLADDPAIGIVACVPGWQAVLDFYADTSSAGQAAIDGIMHLWLDAALRHSYLREQISLAFIEAASPLSVLSGDTRKGQPMPPTPAEITIDIVRRWAAVDRANPARREIKDYVEIALMRPGWRRLLKRVYISLRRLVDANA
jgi:hypothetical protein